MWIGMDLLWGAGVGMVPILWCVSPSGSSAFDERRDAASTLGLVLRGAGRRTLCAERAVILTAVQSLRLLVRRGRLLVGWREYGASRSRAWSEITGGTPVPSLAGAVDLEGGGQQNAVPRVSGERREGLVRLLGR